MRRRYRDGERDRNFTSRFCAIRGRANVSFRAHDLRHRFAVDYPGATGDIYRLSQSLGHRSVKTTELYLDCVDTDSAQKPAHDNAAADEGQTCE